jgi:hypothetical protein
MVRAMKRELFESGHKVATCLGPISTCLEWGLGFGDGLLERERGRKVVEENAFDDGAKGMIASIAREPTSDERGSGRKYQASAADEGAKVVPGHVIEINLTGHRGFRD